MLWSMIYAPVYSTLFSDFTITLAAAHVKPISFWVDASDCCFTCESEPLQIVAQMLNDHLSSKCVGKCMLAYLGGVSIGDCFKKKMAYNVAVWICFQKCLQRKSVAKLFFFYIFVWSFGHMEWWTLLVLLFVSTQY